MATIMKVTVLWEVALCILCRGTNVWKRNAAFILRVKGVRPEDGGSISPRNLCAYLPNYTASHLKSQ